MKASTRLNVESLEKRCVPASLESTWVAEDSGPQDDDWFNSANWSNGIPGTDDLAIIGASDRNVRVSLDATVWALNQKDSFSKELIVEENITLRVGDVNNSAPGNWDTLNGMLGGDLKLEDGAKLFLQGKGDMFRWVKGNITGNNGVVTVTNDTVFWIDEKAFRHDPELQATGNGMIRLMGGLEDNVQFKKSVLLTDDARIFFHGAKGITNFPGTSGFLGLKKRAQAFSLDHGKYANIGMNVALIEDSKFHVRDADVTISGNFGATDNARLLLYGSAGVVCPTFTFKGTSRLVISHNAEQQSLTSLAGYLVLDENARIDMSEGDLSFSVFGDVHIKSGFIDAAFTNTSGMTKMVITGDCEIDGVTIDVLMMGDPEVNSQHKLIDATTMTAQGVFLTAGTESVWDRMGVTAGDYFLKYTGPEMPE